MSRINGYVPSSVQPIRVADADDTKAKARTSLSATPGAAVDATKLSSASAAVAQAASGSDVRTEKVAALQAAIASGTYNVPAGAVADKLISSLLGGL